MQNYSRSRALVRYLATLALCIFLSTVVGSILLLCVGEQPLRVYQLLFQQAFLSERGIMIAIQRAAPLILTSAAATVAFQAGAINMGLAGQFAVGAATAAIAGYALPPLPKLVLIPLILLLCGFTGAVAGFIPAILKRMSGVSEIITGMISNYVIQYGIPLVIGSARFLRVVARGASSKGVQQAAQLTQFVEMTHGGLGSGTKANTGIFVAVGLVLFLSFWMRRSKMGYEMRMTRYNFTVAEFAGIKARRIFFLGMMLSGAIAAMGGAVEILGIWRSYRLETLNIGYKDLVIALIGGQTLVGSLIAALVYGGLESGTMNVAWFTSIPRPFIDILIQLMIIFAALPSMRSFLGSTDPLDVEHLGGRFITKRM